MKKLWQKHWTLHETVELFETQTDLEFDHFLLEWDVVASLAHAKGLQKIGILSSDEFSLLQKGFQQILELFQSGKFALHFGDEDIHTKIENFLVAEYGEVGKKIHTGRSRNDQVLTALRLYTKSELFEIWQELLQLVRDFQQFAQQHEFLPLTGYTHMQQAMPSSFGMWAGAFAEGLLDDLLLLKTAFQLNDQSPLGSAAGYGVPLKLDRQLTANLLGFAKFQNNSMYCQNSRGKVEASILAALSAMLFDLNRFASDVLFFSTSEVAAIEVSAEMCSGSSIMPQKKNVDLAELLRSKVHLLTGNYVQIMSLSTNLISGYNRDLQDTKKPLIESLLIAKECLQVAQLLVKNIQPVHKKLQTEIFATHHALSLLQQGIPFRDAYLQAAEAVAEKKILEPKNFLNLSVHAGGTGNVQLEKITQALHQEKKFLQKKKILFSKRISQLLPSIKKGGS